MNLFLPLRCTAALAAALVCCNAVHAQSNGARASNGSVVSSGSGASATVSQVSVTMQLGTIPILAPAAKNTDFEYEYLDSTGAPLTQDAGKVKSDATGKITILVPPARGHMGAAIRIKWLDQKGDFLYTTIRLKADNGGMFSDPGPVRLVLNGPGVPPGNGPQDWRIQLPPAAADPVEVRFTAGGAQGVVASKLSLGYTALGAGLFDVHIHGTDSTIELESGDMLFFSDLASVGTLDFSGGLQSGRFDFTLFGLAGTWAMDGLGGQVSAVSAAPGSTVFNRLQLVPEPGTAWLVAVALAAAWAPLLTPGRGKMA